jgi:hypothetical protein
VQPLLPPCLLADSLHNTWGFVAVALVQTRHLRPAGFPAWMGHDFYLTGYRIFVRYTTRAGKNLRGLYILQSETDKRSMCRLGNLFTHYRYSLTDIQHKHTNTITAISSVKSRLHIEVNNLEMNPDLPAGSPFANWQEARRYAGPLPFTFTWLPISSEVLMVEGVRQHWQPRPVQVNQCEVGFLQQPAFDGAILANAFAVEAIPYRWKKGIAEQWNP